MAKAHQGSAVGLSLPSIEGPLYRQWSAVAVPVSGLCCSLSTPIAQLCAFGTSNDAILFMQTLGFFVAQTLLQLLPSDWYVYLSSVPPYPLHILHEGRFWVIRCWGSCVAILCSCTGWKYLLPTQELLEVGLQWWGHSNSSSPPSSLKPFRIHHVSCPQFPRLAGASGSLHPPQHLFPCSPCLTWVPSPLQLSPGTSVGLGLETGSATRLYPCGRKLPGGLLNILWTWIIYISGYLSISGYQNVGSYQSIASWWNGSTVLFYPWAWPLPPGPSGGHPSLWPTSPHMNPLSRLWILHMCGS